MVDTRRSYRSNERAWFFSDSPCICDGFNQVLKAALGMVAPDVEIDDGKGKGLSFFTIDSILSVHCFVFAGLIVITDWLPHTPFRHGLSVHSR